MQRVLLRAGATARIVRVTRMGVDERRAARRREIIAATRALFDERGVRDAQIEDIARAVGINRAIIYRHFSSKEELFAVTLVEYLHELESAFAAVVDPSAPPRRRLASIVAAMPAGMSTPASSQSVGNTSM